MGFKCIAYDSRDPNHGYYGYNNDRDYDNAYDIYEYNYYSILDIVCLKDL